MRLQLTRLQLTLLVLLAPSVAHAQHDWRVSADALYYTDTDNVTAVTPAVSVRRRMDGEGSVGARAAVDVVSAASVDIVSQATTRFEEVRTEAAFDLSLPIGDALPSVAYRFSYEPDYLSNGATIGLRTRLGTADSVLSLSYGLTYDVVGLAWTPLSAFSEDLFTHSANLSLTQNLGPETILRAVYALNLQHGFLEKPYRYVPLFDGRMVDIGQLDGASFDSFRMPQRVPENVPDLRHGHAFGLRLLQYIEPIDGSLRLDYQFYFDDWSVTSHVVEAVGLATIIDGLRVGIRGRFYGQTAASFWQRAYVVDTPGTTPRWRSLDRDLSPYVAATGAARIEWALGDFSGYIDGAVTYTRYFDFMLLDDRVAIVSQAGVRWTQ